MFEYAPRGMRVRDPRVHRSRSSCDSGLWLFVCLFVFPHHHHHHHHHPRDCLFVSLLFFFFPPIPFRRVCRGSFGCSRVFCWICTRFSCAHCRCQFQKQLIHQMRLGVLFFSFSLRYFFPRHGIQVLAAVLWVGWAVTRDPVSSYTIRFAFGSLPPYNRHNKRNNDDMLQLYYISFVW
ncbi:hypothetical protein BO70DRAFT_91972 [Aspergillus heteromorphus CBS 117.55]|uniref:Uncharacterized protein n=1 Tax=Aspergillus heteromorphus CBS 117.55 TaxID=1448321 RepID=A0A317VT70_9EURO|nr:uncharacterized protein BO70DRAFT_91972 [Aspergillus heteromorphus CBS 117.55]PWY76217.1 hypothetical protein BO70DRAFT_91972 [Aspergillus heteromorphus CBS 117.55]